MLLINPCFYNIEMPADYRDKYHRDRNEKDRGERRRRGSSEERDHRRSPNDKYRGDRWHSRKSRSRSRTPPRQDSKSNKYKDYPQGRGESKYEGFRSRDEYERRDEREGRTYDSDLKRWDYQDRKGYSKYRHEDKPSERRDYSKDERKDDRRDYNKQQRKEERKDPKKEEKKRWSSRSSHSRSYSPKQSRSKRDDQHRESKQDIKRGNEKPFVFKESNKERRELGKREESIKDAKEDNKVRIYEKDRDEKGRQSRNNDDKQHFGKESNNSEAKKVNLDESIKIDRIEEKVLPKSPEPRRVELKREQSKKEEPKKQDNSALKQQQLPRIGMKYPPPPPPPPAPQFKPFQNKRQPQRDHYKNYDKRDQDRESRRDYQKDYKREYERREPERQNRRESNIQDKDTKRDHGDQLKWNKNNNQKQTAERNIEKLKILREVDQLQPIRRGNDQVAERKAADIPIQKTKVSKFDLMMSEAKNNLTVAPIPSSFLLLDTFKNMNKFYAEILEPRWAHLLRSDLQKYQDFKQPILTAIANSTVAQASTTEQNKEKPNSDSKLWLWVKQDRKEEEIDLKFRLQEMRQQGAIVSQLVRRLRFLD